MGRRRSSAREPAAVCVLLLLLMVVMIAIPTQAAAAPKGKGAGPTIPRCTGLSTAAMARVLGSPPLVFKGETPHSNLCTWDAHRNGHYHEALSIDIIPGIKSIYEQAEAEGRKNATKEGRTFGTLGTRHSPWKAAFFVSGTVSNGELEACPQEHVPPMYGPPQCSGDPAWTVNNVDSYDSAMMVSVGVGAQLGDAYLSHVIELNREIITGKIP